MAGSVPHPIPYQGSKRHLATQIAALFPDDIDTLFEPFAGSAAVTLFAARHGLARRFVVGDSLPQLVELWRRIVAAPDAVADQYERVWLGQAGGGPDYFNGVRERFNRDGDPVDLLYLIARCVKNAVRFNRHGRFTQSADRRRLGMRPAKLREAVTAASRLLAGRAEFVCGDFQDTVAAATRRDLLYMDPPYQGTTYGRDKRYYAQLGRERLVAALAGLNARRVPFLLSYDGMTGVVVYGEALPAELRLERLLLHAGRSSQATLNGRDDVTVESLYVSPHIAPPARVRAVKLEQADLFAAA